MIYLKIQLHQSQLTYQKQLSCQELVKSYLDKIKKRQNSRFFGNVGREAMAKGKLDLKMQKEKLACWKASHCFERQSFMQNHIASSGSKIKLCCAVQRDSSEKIGICRRDFYRPRQYG